MFQRNLHIMLTVVGIVAVWRGVWHLLDSYLFPSNPLISSLVSLSLGIVILLLSDKKHILNALTGE
jgi:hypothetical protein